MQPVQEASIALPPAMAGIGLGLSVAGMPAMLGRGAGLASPGLARIVRRRSRPAAVPAAPETAVDPVARRRDND